SKVIIGGGKEVIHALKKMGDFTFDFIENTNELITFFRESVVKIKKIALLKYGKLIYKNIWRR
ncbi:MAG: hypothetical protein ACOCQA_03175, partial [bacterium]